MENTYTIHDKEVEYKHSDKLPQPKYKEYKLFIPIQKAVSTAAETVGICLQTDTGYDTR